MIYEISNGVFTARVDSLGAQLVSLKATDGFELLWVGDPGYWREHAPVLFPIVGALRDGRARIDGRWYEMSRHGFAKRMEFALEEQGEGYLSLALSSNDETRKEYPFDFEFAVTYELSSEGITTRFTVRNTGSLPLPYSVGGHPGFNLPMGEDARFEDYTIQFPEQERQDCPAIDLETGLIHGDKKAFRLDGKEIPLQHSLFYQDALVFEGLKSNSVRVVNKKSGRGVEMDFTGFPMLGIWSAVNDGPYVCLEPWTGCATLTTEGDDFVEKKGMAQLAPGREAEHSFTVRFLGMDKNVSWKQLQKDVYRNKLDHGFNVTDVNLEFCYLYGELSEAHAAWRTKDEGLGQELADVAIYLLGLSEILGYDLDAEVRKKMEINKKRRYTTVDGVLRRVED